MNHLSMEKALIKEAQHGNKGAFGALVVKYQPRLSAAISRFGLPQSDTNDLAQETFIKAYKGLGAFRLESSFYTWLYRIAKNTSESYRMKQHPHESLDEKNTEKATQYWAKDPASICSKAESQDVMEAAIEKLPGLVKEPLLLYEMHGLSYEAIAEQLHVPVGTIRSRIHRARTLLEKSIRH